MNNLIQRSYYLKWRINKQNKKNKFLYNFVITTDTIVKLNSEYFPTVHTPFESRNKPSFLKKWDVKVFYDELSFKVAMSELK